MVSSSALMAAASIGPHLNSARPSNTQQPVLALERNWHRAPHGAGAGLFNMGNTCYLNSVLQCLAHLPPLANLCHAQAHRRTCARTQGGNTCICCLLESQLTRQLYGTKGEFRPEALYSHLLNLGRGFVRYRQEDAHELLRCLTDEMERCLLRQSLGYNPQRAPRCPKTWVNSLFSGILQSQVRCLRCGYVSNSYDPFMDLSLELQPGCGDLRQCMRHFTAAETLDGKNCYRCDGCRQLVPAKKQITIWDDPNVLVVHLKRFHDFSGQKISQVISYPLNLDLEEHMCPTRRLQQQQPQQQQQALQFLQAPRAVQQQQQRAPTAAVFTNNGYKRANIGVSNFKLGEQVLRQQQAAQQQRALMHQQAQQHQQLAHLKAQHLQPQQLNQQQQQQHGDPAAAAAAGPSNRSGPGHYELHGVLVHKGFTANSGHYYAYVRGGDPTSHWFCANDSNVYRPQTNEALGQTRDAYMLFYVRRSMKQQADLPAQPEAPPAAAAAAGAAQPAAAAGAGVAAAAAAAQRLKRSSDVMIGPQLPPHLQQKRQRLQEQEPAVDAMDTDDQQHPAATAGGVIEPQLPPGYQRASSSAAAAAGSGAGPSSSTAAAAGEQAPAPLSPAAAAARAAEIREAAGQQASSSSGSGAAANGLRTGLLLSQPAATPQPAPPAAASSGQQHPPSPAVVTSVLAGYLPDYEDEEDIFAQPAAAAAAEPAQVVQQLQQQQLQPEQPQEAPQQQEHLQHDPQPAAAAAPATAAAGPSGGSGGGCKAQQQQQQQQQQQLASAGDVQAAQREQIKSKLWAELSLRSDFKPALVDMLTVARDQGKPWRQVKPMLLMMLRQSAAVKETAEAVFAPFLRMAQTALSVCL